jgi:hypothetical protein
MRRRCHLSLEEEMSAFCCDFKEERLPVFFSKMKCGGYVRKKKRIYIYIWRGGENVMG